MKSIIQAASLKWNLQWNHYFDIYIYSLYIYSFYDTDGRNNDKIHKWV